MLQANALIVDDEQEFLEAVAQRLANRGFTVDTALNGAEALAKIGEKVFDAMVLDLMMPEIDGMETLKRALQKSRNCRSFCSPATPPCKAASRGHQAGDLGFPGEAG